MTNKKGFQQSVIETESPKTFDPSPLYGNAKSIRLSLFTSGLLSI